MLLKIHRGCLVILVFLTAYASGELLSQQSKLADDSQEGSVVMPPSGSTRRFFTYDINRHVLNTLANTGFDVVVGIGNERLPFISEFQDEATEWANTNVVPFFPATKITHVLVGNDVFAASPDDAVFLIPSMEAMQNAMAESNLHGRIKISTLLSAESINTSHPVQSQLLQILSKKKTTLFLLPANISGVTDRAVEAVGQHGVDVSIVEAKEFTSGVPLRRELATGTLAGQYCVANPNADQNTLQAALNYACGQGGANCTAIQPNGVCYKANNLQALASYAFNDYYHRFAANGATCSFNGAAVPTNTDPSSGNCIFAGSPLQSAPPGTVAPPAPGAVAPAGVLGPPGSFNSSLVPPGGSGSFTPVPSLAPPLRSLQAALLLAAAVHVALAA